MSQTQSPIQSNQLETRIPDYSPPRGSLLIPMLICVVGMIAALYRAPAIALWLVFAAVALTAIAIEIAYFFAKRKYDRDYGRRLDGIAAETDLDQAAEALLGTDREATAYMVFTYLLTRAEQRAGTAA